MKKIKNINTILIILIMLNYTFFSMFSQNNPADLNEGIDFGKVSSIDFDNLMQIVDFDTFGMGYAVMGILYRNTSLYVVGVKMLLWK